MSSSQIAACWTPSRFAKDRPKRLAASSSIHTSPGSTISRSFCWSGYGALIHSSRKSTTPTAEADGEAVSEGMMTSHSAAAVRRWAAERSAPTPHPAGSAGADPDRCRNPGRRARRLPRARNARPGPWTRRRPASISVRRAIHAGRSVHGGVIQRLCCFSSDTIWSAARHACAMMSVGFLSASLENGAPRRPERGWAHPKSATTGSNTQRNQ